MSCPFPASLKPEQLKQQAVGTNMTPNPRTFDEFGAIRRRLEFVFSESPAPPQTSPAGMSGSGFIEPAPFSVPLAVRKTSINQVRRAWPD
jgi:hypothetical protein